MAAQPPLPSHINISNKPSIVSWNRLEPRPRDWQFNRALRAEVRDPAWMLARQWQVGEFQAENRASPAFAQVEYEIARLTHFKPGPMAGSRPVETYVDDIPLEVQVEREKVEIDLNLQLQMGQFWMRLFLRNFNFLARNQYKTLLEELRIKLPIDKPNDVTPGYSLEYGKSLTNASERQMLVLAAGRTFDGYDLYDKVKNDNAYFKNFVFDLFPGEPAATDLDNTFNDKVWPQFQAWYQRQYSQPDYNGPTAWDNSSLEYKFKAASSLLKDGVQQDQVLAADDYASGRLDWYAFDAESAGIASNPPTNYGGNSPVESFKFTFFPTNIQFPGAPNARWWEFEDSKLNLGKMNFDTSDVGRMFFLDFMFLYNNDWFSFPVNMKTGSICKVKKLVVTDVFNKRHDIKPAGEGSFEEEEDWGRWSMYAISERGDTEASERRIFLPPTVANVLEGDPIEKVNFLRDEMANLVWGVEQIIPDGMGRGMSGSMAAQGLAEYLKSKQQQTANSPITADYVYKLANQVPENWIPFIPTKLDINPIDPTLPIGREIRYQVGGMPRTVEGITWISGEDVVDPRGRLLRDLENSTNPYLYEEEVPREGTTVTRTFQRTRWFNGKTFVWLGRQKKVGKGEGSSGLLFDQLVPVEQPT